MFSAISVVVRGGGDLGSGVVYRLHRAGFPVIIAELAQPLFVRRPVCYGMAVYEDSVEVDGIVARRVTGPDEAAALVQTGVVPVLVAPDRAAFQALSPVVVVDARMAKRPLDTAIGDAPLVVALGPGFEAGIHCHAVVETNRGHFLGRVYWKGQAEPDTGVPGMVNGAAALRVLRTPASGHVLPQHAIGDRVSAGETVALVSGIPVVAQLGGVLRGLIHPSIWVTEGLKIGDIDPRAVVEHCFSISDKSLAVGGGVLEAILSSRVVRQRLADDRAGKRAL